MPTHPSHHDPDGGPGGTTRTRLPEGGSSAARRPPVRSSRTLVTVVGVFVLLIAALAFATRGPSSSGDHASPSSPHASSTAPTGALPPTTTPTSPPPPPSPHTPEGAQSAAANYAVALGGDGMFTTPTRHQIVATVTDPTALGKLQSSLDSDYSSAFLSQVGLNEDGTAPQGETFVNRTIPVGTKTTGYSSGSAVVSVWCMGLSGLAGNASTKPVTSNWFTTTLTLTWHGSGWLVLSLTQSSGPTPVAGDQTVSGAKQIANAVQGYGGFTYAR